MRLGPDGDDGKFGPGRAATGRNDIGWTMHRAESPGGERRVNITDVLNKSTTVLVFACHRPSNDAKSPAVGMPVPAVLALLSARSDPELLETRAGLEALSRM